MYEFDGELLAESTSERPDEDRWVEFQLYRTKAGSYVMSRIGQTRLYHDPGCAIVTRNHLKPSSADDLTPDHVPCQDCVPHPSDDVVAIERPRYFALVSDEPDAVLDALYKYDRSGARYLTLVAQRLLEEAGTLDARIDKAYRVEYID